MITTMTTESSAETLELSDGGRLRYATHGEGSPILLIHGTGGSAWFDSVSRLSRTHLVITYDRRGTGGSTGDQTSTYLTRHVEDAAELMRHLNVSRATVVGHSWGGIVALSLAANHPDLVARLVLMEPPYHAKAHMTPGFLLAFVRIQILRKVKGAEAATVAFLRFATHRTDRLVTYDQLPPEVKADLDGNAAGTMAELDAGTGEELGEQSVASIKTPVLLLEGALSQKIFRNSSARLAVILPQAHVQVLPGASHMMQFDAPSDFERAVLSVAG